MPPDSLPALAQRILTAVEDAAADHGITLPDQRYIAPGAVAWDCSQLVVQTPQIFRGLPAQPFADVNRPGDVFSAEFTVWLLRCTPSLNDDGTPIHEATLNASGQEILRDGWLLTVGMAPRLKVIGADCTSLATGPCVGQGPDGGLAGWSLTLIAGL